MRTPWWIYLIVGLIAGLAGIAIAGLPDGTPVTETIVVPPSTTTTTTPTTTTSTTSTTPTTTAISTSTQPDTTVDTSPPATESVAAPSSADATAAAGDQPLIAEADLFVVVANGAGIAGLAARTTETLRAVGYVDSVATDGLDTTDATTVYFESGLEREAARLAVVLGLPPAAIAARIDAPNIEGTAPSGAVLIAYLGRDFNS